MSYSSVSKYEFYRRVFNCLYIWKSLATPQEPTNNEVNWMTNYLEAGGSTIPAQPNNESAGSSPWERRKVGNTPKVFRVAGSCIDCQYVPIEWYFGEIQNPPVDNKTNPYVPNLPKWHGTDSNNNTNPAPTDPARSKQDETAEATVTIGTDTQAISYWGVYCTQECIDLSMCGEVNLSSGRTRALSISEAYSQAVTRAKQLHGVSTEVFSLIIDNEKHDGCRGSFHVTGYTYGTYD